MVFKNQFQKLYNKSYDILEDMLKNCDFAIYSIIKLTNHRLLYSSTLNS